MDESPRQLIRATRLPLAAEPGSVEREDYGMNVFMAVDPLAGKRLVRVTERKTRTDWVVFLEKIAGCYVHAERITLVMDNLNTHARLALRGIYAVKSKSALETFRVYLYPQARELAQHGRNRI